MEGRMKALGVGGAAFLLALAACSMVVHSSIGSSSLMQIQPEVIYLSPAQAQQQLKAEAEALTSSNRLITPQGMMLADDNQTDSDNATESGKPFSGYRSCGIYDLVQQARAVFPHWDRCGYMLQEADGLKMRVGWGSGGVISAPTDDIECTPKKLTKEPCKSEMVRTVAYNDESSLKDCMLKIPGLSQTCDLYANCGPQPQHTVWTLGTTSVCAAPEGGYYREPSVQRMCGICQMFHATTGILAETPEDLGTGKDDGGCIADGQAMRVIRDQQILDIRVEDVIVGDRVQVSDEDQVGRKVYFIHAHKNPIKTVAIHWIADTDKGSVELTPMHRIPVKHCGGEGCTVAAGAIRKGHTVFSNAKEAEVLRVDRTVRRVRQLLVEGEALVVGRTWVSVWSSPLRSLETLPFRFLESLCPGILQWEGVAAAIALVLDSPAIRAAASVAHALAPNNQGLEKAQQLRTTQKRHRILTAGDPSS